MQTTLLLKQVSRGIRSHQEGPTKSKYLFVYIHPRISQREVFSKFRTILRFRSFQASIGTTMGFSSFPACCIAQSTTKSQRPQTVI